MTDIDPNKAIDFMLVHAPKLAKAKADRIYMEEFRKTIKARLMASCSEPSLGAQERDAYASDEYENHLHALQAAVEAEEVLRWQMIAAQARVDVWRSQEASNRRIDRAAQ